MNTFNPTDNRTFDVNTYETEDLLGILDLTGDAPINKEKIDERIQLLKYKLRNNSKKDKIYTFLDKSADKLKKNFEKFNNQTWEQAYTYDESEATQVFTNQ